MNMGPVHCSKHFNTNAAFSSVCEISPSAWVSELAASAEMGLQVRDWQLFRVIREYVGYFNRARPKQGLKQKIPEA